MTQIDFIPSRAAGLARAAEFQRSMGQHYRNLRNFDFGPEKRTNVSALSPWIRHRLITEAELAQLALDTHSAAEAEKFLQEVCWRTYWKGWLEQHPAVWRSYEESLKRELDGAGDAYRAAIEGRTGIDAFDAWANELITFGYLANHTRMWFASIWIFTLRLPWQLGADFFLRHLMDGDAASNTLSWRWVAGLHTSGKTYLATKSNIEKYTNARFAPTGLAGSAHVVGGYQNPSPSDIPQLRPLPGGAVGVLLTEEDLHAESLVPAAKVAGVAGAVFPHLRSPNGVGARAEAFTTGALTDGLALASDAFSCEALALSSEDFVDAATDWAQALGVSNIVTAYAPTGWVRPRLQALETSLAANGIGLYYARRDWDEAFWPHASKGFFGLKKKMTRVFDELGMSAQGSLL